jgi:hypothetical protein
MIGVNLLEVLDLGTFRFSSVAGAKAESNSYLHNGEVQPTALR